MTPRDRFVASLVLLLVLILSLSCNPNPQPEGLTPIPTLAPAATLTLIPALEGAPVTGGEPAPTSAPEGGDPTSGAAIFAQNCAVCHGQNAEGGTVGPTLVSAEMKAKDDDYYRQLIANGVPGTAMPAWEGRLNTQEVEDLIAFLRSVQ
jgi:mono/diheme cytochrome c family protein